MAKQIKPTRTFHHGDTILEVGKVCKVDDDLAEVCVKNGWAVFAEEAETKEPKKSKKANHQTEKQADNVPNNASENSDNPPTDNAENADNADSSDNLPSDTSGSLNYPPETDNALNPNV